MKEVNLISVVNAHKSLSTALLKSYFDNFMINPKKEELEDLESYIEQLELVRKDIKIFDKYFFGYKIPQISKEFDLLRFGKDSIINIELKSSSTAEKIKKQLIQNRYYLSFLNKKVNSFTYVSEEKKLYSIDITQNLIEVSFNVLHEIISNQEPEYIYNIDTLFNPSNYLVSPFNSTNEFLQNKYFLTAQQEEIKTHSLDLIKNASATFISISGNAGTGKTLLTYDIAKEILNKKLKVLIIHCGLLNEGHLKLRDENLWNIIPIKEYKTCRLSDYFLIIIDETQRIYKSQLKEIIDQIKSNNGNCIFSFDSQQCLTKAEIKNNIAQYIADETSSTVFKLTEKIRTNKEIASFIIALFDKSKQFHRQKILNVELNFFQNDLYAKNYIELLGKQGWKIINFTPSTYKYFPYDDYNFIKEDNAHKVIGQEFDQVVAIIDQHFYYNGNRLSTKGYRNRPYYHPTKMLFQIMTRTRKKLNIVVINNKEVLERCLCILGHSLNVENSNIIISTTN